MWEAPSRKRYVGVTNSIERRRAEYRRKANAGAQWPIHRAIRKYGDQMKFRILFTETGEGARQRALEAEAFLVDFGDFDLNAAPGGQESPSTWADVAKKISVATKARMSTPEAKARVSEQSKARWKDQDFRQKMREIDRVELSAQARLNIGRAQRKRFANRVGTQNLDAAHAKQMRPIVCIETKDVFDSLADAINWLKAKGHPKASKSALSRVAYGLTKTAYGFKWAHKSESSLS